MDEEIDRLVIGVRADTGGFANDVAAMRGSLEAGLGTGADLAGKRIETALGRAVASGKVGFDDLKRVGLSAMDAIAASAVHTGVNAAVGETAGSAGSGLLTVATALASSLLGLPGRATGGPVSPGRAYMVGERGPELFVPTSSGRVEAAAPAGRARDVRVSIAVNGGGGDQPQALARSGRQVARAVARALQQAGG